jgi:hypothetical protein
MASTQSTVTLQQIVDIAQAFGDLAPVLNVGGSSSQPALTIANDVMNSICALPFPHKWNELNLPVFYTNSYQQDYAGINPDGSSVTTLSWLERGTVFDINNTAVPKPFRTVECGRQLPQATGTFWNSSTGSPLYLCNFFPNSTLYYGVWGDADTGNATLGNNPVAGSVYTSPLGTGSMPSNPITQIVDANNNLLVLTGYGTEGSTAPVAPANSAAGTVATPGSGATTQWKVVDPNGVGFRILPVPSETGVVWQFALTGQMKPVRFTSLSQTLNPLPDEFEPNFRAGFISQCYRYSPEAKIRAKFKEEWALWLASLIELRAKEDRELEENMFTPDRGIMGGTRGRNRFLGPQYPFNYPLS